MTEKETLEHEIKVLEEAEMIMSKNDFDRAFPAECAGHLRDKLAELTKPKFKDGTLGQWVDKETDTRGKIVEYNCKLQNPPIDGWIFEPLPIETILRHLAPEGCDSWRYVSKNSVSFFKQGWSTIDDNTGQFRIPATYREDWENIGGELEL